MDVVWLLRKGLAKDPANRYQSADDLIARLNDRAVGKVPIQCPITFTKRTGYEAMRLLNWAPLAIPTLVIAGAIGAGIYMLVR